MLFIPPDRKFVLILQTNMGSYKCHETPLGSIQHLSSRLCLSVPLCSISQLVSSHHHHVRICPISYQPDSPSKQKTLHLSALLPTLIMLQFTSPISAPTLPNKVITKLTHQASQVTASAPQPNTSAQMPRKCALDLAHLI